MYETHNFFAAHKPSFSIFFRVFVYINKKGKVLYALAFQYNKKCFVVEISKSINQKYDYFNLIPTVKFNIPPFAIKSSIAPFISFPFGIV